MTWKYRVAKHNGDVLDRVDGTNGETFGSEDAIAIAEIAAALDVPEKEITLEVRDTPPARFDKIIPQPPPVVQPPTIEQRLETMLDAIINARSFEDVRVAAMEMRG